MAIPGLPLLSKTLIIVLLYAKQVRVPTSMGILTVKIRCRAWCLMERREKMCLSFGSGFLWFSRVSTELASCVEGACFCRWVFFFCIVGERFSSLRLIYSISYGNELSNASRSKGILLLGVMTLYIIYMYRWVIRQKGHLPFNFSTKKLILPQAGKN